MRVIFLIMIGVSLSLASDVLNDSKTGLTWQDNSAVANTKMSWTEAVSYCSDLRLAGHSDWYLPSIKELQSIVDINKYNPAINNGFKNVNASGYWSSSVINIFFTKNAWTVSFFDGSTGYDDKADEFYVRCVRGRQ